MTNYRTALLSITGIVVTALMVLATTFIYGHFFPAEKLVITKEVLFERGLNPIPHAIVRTNDGGFIIAGKLDEMKMAWAIRTDAEGKLIWRHILPAREFAGHTKELEYDSAAVMPDDSVFLCGQSNEIAGRGIPVPALLTHIDKDGHVLEIKYPIAENDNRHSISHIMSCTSYRDGVILAGLTFLGGLASSDKDLLWVLSLDQNGQTRWEKTFQSTYKLDQLRISPLKVSADGSFVFSAIESDKGNFKTEVLRLGATGEIKQRNTFDGWFSLAQPIDAQSIEEPRLVSYGSYKTTDIFLDERLQEIGRRTIWKFSYDVRRAYYFSDGSILLFGSADHEGSDHDASVIKLGPTFLHSRQLFFAPKHTSYSINDAIPLDRPEEFAAVRSIHKRFMPLQYPKSAGPFGWAMDLSPAIRNWHLYQSPPQQLKLMPGAEQPSMALDFITIKPTN